VTYHYEKYFNNVILLRIAFYFDKIGKDDIRLSTAKIYVFSI